ncbi:iron-containing redox enzyme family protein [Curtobacterium sp. MCSS17_007]|uniref:iron-containing redox enzyme family protein n=1 Tax=Curtobacterium sp. MCSS17_007 TaxID=2175646 RepID=UPI0021AC8A6F|nr:iron-containing redox enzyme family protein [Curtobacterium sp. MCSS17_007]WIE76966.1 iron-containing redox enzyme family protein [Curtobacterium sp. MCSS17_007]
MAVLDDADVLTQTPMPVPEARGPLSAALIDALTTGTPGAGTPGAGTPGPDALRDAATAAVDRAEDVLTDDDVQLTLFLLYELHYGGIVGVDDDLEWDPALLAARAVLETAHEAAVRAVVPLPERPEPTAEAVSAALFALTAADSGPSLSRWVARKADREHIREFLVQKSIYTLKEADPHSWAIPRLSGRAKSALVEIQSDEYGGGRPKRIHSAIFARTVRAAGLDDSYGRYVDLVPAITLAALNTMSLFGLHRRLRGAVVGHLAAFEMTSSVPSRLYGDGFRRNGFDEDATWYFDEHVEADAVHEQIAGRDLAGGLVAADPALLGDVLFGAAACLVVEGMVGAHVLNAWESGTSSLRRPLPADGVPA